MSSIPLGPRWTSSLSPWRLAWALMAVLAVGVALFSVPPYLLADREANRIPLNPEAVSHFLWISLHAVPGSLALLLGPIQLSSWMRARYLRLHRWTGRVYMLCILVGGVTSVVAAVLSTSGLAAQLGFLLLAAAWMYSAWRALAAVYGGRIDEHRTWMVRNYALTFAAVLLRVFLGMGLLAMSRGYDVSFEEVYTSAVWGSIFVSYVGAEWFILRLDGRPAKKRTGPASGLVTATVAAPEVLPQHP